MEKALALILLILACTFAFAKGGSEKRGPLILKHADQMQNHGSGNKMWSHLTGDVEFQHGEVNLKSQEADYFRAEQRIELKKNVILSVPNKQLTAERLSYRKSDQRVEARGRMMIKDLNEGTMLTGEWGEYYRDKKLAHVYGRPVLTNVDSAKNDTLKIVSDTIIFNENKNKATALGNVVITMSNSTATGGRGEYFEDSLTAFLKDNPVFTQGNNRMKGTVIRLLLKDQALEEIFVCENAEGTYFEADSTADTAKITEVFGDTINMKIDKDVIKEIYVMHKARSVNFIPGQRAWSDEARGNLIRMTLDSNTVQEVLINGNARSTYYSREKNEILGKNNARGDTIYVAFDNNEVSSVSVFGGARGKYFIVK